MQEFIDFNKKSRRTIRFVKNDLRYLLEMNKDRDEEFKQLKKSMKKIQKELDNIENLFQGKTEVKEDQETQDITDELDYDKEKRAHTDVIMKKLTIKKREKSPSFKAWAFNNNEL